MRKTPLLTLFLVVLLASFTSVLAAEEAPAPEGSPAADTTATAEPENTYQPFTVLGMKVWIDPETGQMRAPTAEEAAQLAATAQQQFRTRTAAPAAAPKTHANGAVSVRLDPSLMDFSVARVTSDGKTHFDCVDSLEAATALIGTQVAEPEEE